MRLVVVVVMLTACAAAREAPGSALSVPRTPEEQPEATPAGSPAPSRAHQLRPAPPSGFVVPGIGRPRRVEGGSEKTAFVWEAVWEVDPRDARVERGLADARRDGLNLDAGDVGAILYREQVRAAGLEVRESGPSFSYLIENDQLDVIVLPDDRFHRDDPNGYTISIGPRGG